MSTTPNLRLPYLDPNQNQKSVTHNAALRMLDALVNLRVSSAALAAPPAAPNDGERWIVAPGAAGAWAGKDLNVAAWQDGAWSFYAPNPGTVAYVDALGGALVWDGAAWGSLLGAVATLALSSLGVGGPADPANPLSARLNAALLAAAPTTASPPGTGDVRLKLSKQGAANTASLVFQDGYAGRAEIGLAGDDDLRLKVSADGALFRDALVAGAASGAVWFPQSPSAPTPAPGDNAARLATTAYADRAAAAVIARAQVSDAPYAAGPADRTVAVIALTAARTVTLPAASAFPAGATLTVVDESGACSPTRAVTVAAAGADAVNGAPSAVLSTPYGYLALQSNTANKWTVVDQPAACAWTPPQGRLTLQSGAPVMAGAVQGASGITYTPHTGDLVGLWNGAGFVTVPFTEVGQSLADGAKSPSPAAAGQVYDLFGWMDGATFRVTRGPAWAAGAAAGSNGARGQGAGSTQLARVQGVLVNAFPIVNGPAAGFGTYLGTVMTDAGAATATFNTGSVAAGWGAATVGLWNAYGRVPVEGTLGDTTPSWTYAAAAWRPAHGSANARVSFVAGLAEDVWGATYAFGSSNPSGAYAAGGVGVNSTTAVTGISSINNSTLSLVSYSRASVQPLGANTMTALEYISAGTATFYGNGGAGGVYQTGLAWSGRY